MTTDGARSVLLVGMRGSGKSSVGAAVARTLGIAFVDLDDEVLARAGFESVAAMWGAKGQGAFRDAEVRTLRALLDDERSCVIALGGGTPTAPGAEDLINDARRRGRAIVVYLRCSLATLEARLRDSLRADANRPSVTGADPVRELGDLLRAREPVYRGITDLEIDGDRGSVEEVARLVIDGVMRRAGTGRP